MANIQQVDAHDETVRNPLENRAKTINFILLARDLAGSTRPRLDKDTDDSHCSVAVQTNGQFSLAQPSCEQVGMSQ